MTTVEEADGWIGRVAIDRTRRRIGRITQVWVDDYSGRPAWATVETGRVRRRLAMAPLSEATAAQGRPRLACTKAVVSSAPQADEDGHLGLDAEWRLFVHYGLPGAPDPTRQTPPSLPGDLPGITTRLSTGTSTRLVPPTRGAGTASGESAGQDPNRRISSGWTSGRAFLADVRRSLGLG